MSSISLACVRARSGLSPFQKGWLLKGWLLKVTKTIGNNQKKPKKPKGWLIKVAKTIGNNQKNQKKQSFWGNQAWGLEARGQAGSAWKLCFFVFLLCPMVFATFISQPFVFFWFFSMVFTRFASGLPPRGSSRTECTVQSIGNRPGSSWSHFL